MTAPLGLDHYIVKFLLDKDPSKCSEIGLHNVGGHSLGGTSCRSVKHFRQLYEAKRF